MWLCYTFESWKISGSFDILNDISKYVILVQFLESIGNVSHALTIYVNMILYSNHKKHFLC